MITGDRITLDPDLRIAARDHRYRIVTTDQVLGQLWQCVRCGQTTRPSDPFVDCTAGPVTA